MSEFDVRFRSEVVVDVIRFGDDKHKTDGAYCASTLKICGDYLDRVGIYDHGDEFVLIHDAEHARHLIAALDKAVKLGWLK